MGNMSYCRFENTLSDLRDCQSQLEALLEGDGECTKISQNNQQERLARIKLVEVCLEIAEMFVSEAENVDPREAIKRKIEQAENRLEQESDD